MAALTVTIPAGAQTLLDAYAVKQGFTDFRAMTIDWMKRTAAIAYKEDNQAQANALLAAAATPPTVNIT